MVMSGWSPPNVWDYSPTFEMNDTPSHTIQQQPSKQLIEITTISVLSMLFVFAYAKSRFSHNEAHISNSTQREELPPYFNDGSD